MLKKHMKSGKLFYSEPKDMVVRINKRLKLKKMGAFCRGIFPRKIASIFLTSHTIPKNFLPRKSLDKNVAGKMLRQNEQTRTEYDGKICG